MKTKVDNIYDFSEKWSSEISIYNFTQVPNLLLGCQGHLNLTDGELVTLIHLLTFWFRHDSKIYPSIETLTKFSHKGYSTIQKRLRILEDKGFINRRHKLGTTNTYDIKPCIAKLHKHQQTCTRPPRKQAEYWNKATRVPASRIRSKEDEALRRLTSNNTMYRPESFINGITII